VKDKLIKIFKTVGLFLLYFSISSIPILIFNINVENFSDLDLILYSFGCNIIFLIVIVACYFKTLKKDFKPYFKNFINNLEESFKYYIIGLGIMIVSNLLITYILGGGIAENEQQVRSFIDIAPIIMLIEVSIYAPLAEELLFRKSIREVIKSKWIYVLVSGFIFGGLHVLGCENPLEYLYLIPYCSLGFAFSYIYAKTDNIYSTIMIHTIHNTVTIILYFIGASL